MLNRVLIDALLAPATAASWALRDWDRCIRHGRAAGLLPRVAAVMRDSGFLSSVPEAPRLHLEASATLARKQVRDVHWEIACLKAALARLNLPLVLLKGAAYIAADVPTASGRLFGDIDILVPRDRLADVERVLDLAGWQPARDLDPYDERFYREWMHEIPPLTHASRGTTVDVHHTIVPMTARAPISGTVLHSSIRETRMAGVYVLQPADMVLHSAVHLFNEGEFQRALRDLSDLDLLLRHYGRDPEFWASMMLRARELGLGRPLFYAFRWCARIFGTPIPADVRSSAEEFAPAAPVRYAMDVLFSYGFRPPHPDFESRLASVALLALYIRGHWLRLPVHLLVPHLARKAVRRREKQRT